MIAGLARLAGAPWAGLALKLLAGAAVFGAGTAAGMQAQYHLRQRPAVAAVTLDLADLRSERAAELMARDVEIMAWQSSNRFLTGEMLARAEDGREIVRTFNEDIRNDALPELARPVDPTRALRLCRAQASAQGRPAADCSAIAGGRAGP